MVVKKSFASAKLVGSDDELEVIWVKLTPVNAPEKPCFTCVFYSPPLSSKGHERKGKMQEHLVEMISIFKTQEPSAEFIIAGDVNNDDFEDLNSVADLKDVVKEPTRVTTRTSSCLDKIYSTLPHASTVVLNPISSNDGQSVSDHKTPVAEFYLRRRSTNWTTYWRRQFAPNNHRRFSEYMSSLNWKEYPKAHGVDQMVDDFQCLLSRAVDVCFPTKKIRAKNSDPKWLTDHLRDLIIRKGKMYKKYGNSERFKKFKSMVRKKIRESKATYFQRRISSLQKSNPRAWYKELELLVGENHPSQNEELHVPDLEGMESIGKAETLVKRIEEITKHYEPIKHDFFRWKYPPTNPNGLRLTVEEVRKRIETQKVPRGQHPDDIPRILIKRYAGFFSIPLTFIYNRILQSGCWPSQWKVELTRFIKK